MHDESEAAWVESHLRPLVGLGADTAVGGDRRDEAFTAWRRFLESLAEAGPFVVVFDDLHWADEALLDFVDHLVEWAADVPLLVVAIARPELLARRPNWGGGKSNATTRSLAALSDDETTALVHAVLGRAVLPAETQRALVVNAGGNPLYAEEFARMLAEGGAADAGSLPESVQGLIAARLDGIEPAGKALMQDAAVLGKVFWLGALAAIAEEEPGRLERRLHQLERRELVRRDRASTVDGERQYAFRHLLVRDVAYSQIPRARRAQKHAAAARWIEGLSADRSEDRAEMLAHHWSAALRYARLTGGSQAEFADRAVAALTDAGERALGVHAAAAAASLYEQALELIGDEPPPQLLLAYGRSLYLAGDPRAEASLERARDGLAAAGDRAGEAFALAMLSHVSWLAGDTDAATLRIDDAAERVRDLPASEMKAHVLARAASRAHVANRSEEAAALAREALTLADELEIDDVRIHALTTLGSARGGLGDFDGISDLERAYELGVAANSPEAGRAAQNLGVDYFLRGDVARYRELRDEALPIYERFGQRSNIRFWLGSEMSMPYLFGDWDEAVRKADAFIAECEAEPHYQEAHARAFRAAIRFGRDDIAGALSDLDRALAGPSDPQSRGPALEIAARVFCEIGDPRAIPTALQGLGIDFGTTPPPLALALLSPIEVPPVVHERLRSVVAAHDASPSRWVSAARAMISGRHLDAADIYASMPFLPGVADARERAAEVLVAEGRHSEAEAQLEQALAFWRSVGATRYIRRADALRNRIVA